MTTANGEPEGTHHYILTLQTSTPNGYTITTNSGAYTPPEEGETRYQSFHALLRHVGGESSGASVLFFSLEPNFTARPTG
ncbi:hypothetical protein ACFYRI_15140 [Streptomyces microflavus]|uniref:hypothetical protein n=1 Tax=Streptomyces microflavus TaxID=1919 RepID=UPI0036A41FE4